jgi:nucleoside-diphosphate-sugar epimerase
MKIFLTGGTGFIGSHFINKAHSQGFNLVCLRRPGSVTRVELIDNPKWLNGSLEDDWVEEMRGCDIFVHLASHSTNVPYDTLEKCLYWNLTVSLKLMEQAREAGISKFIISGTGFEYGRVGEKYDYIPINANLEPTMAYPASKAAAYIAFYQWAVEYKLQLNYLRIFQVFGEGESEGRLWPSLKKAALSGNDFDLTLGEQVRDFTHVDDIVSQFVEFFDFSSIKPGSPMVTHVSCGKPQTIREFSEFWWKQWGATGKLNFGVYQYRKNEVMRFVPKVSGNLKKITT